MSLDGDFVVALIRRPVHRSSASKWKITSAIAAILRISGRQPPCRSTHVYQMGCAMEDKISNMPSYILNQIYEEDFSLLVWGSSGRSSLAILDQP